jgi:hypothetical protein
MESASDSYDGLIDKRFKVKTTSDEGGRLDSALFLVISFGPASVAYVFFRLLTDLFAFSQISWALFRQNLYYGWTIVDIVSVIMILTSLIIDIKLEGTTSAYFTFQAFTIGILWIKVLGFLQLLNRKLAAYILAVFEMIKEVWQFSLVLLVMVFGFGDMFFTIYTIYREEGGYDSVCPNFGDESLSTRVESQIESPFCSSSRYPGYLGVYRLFVGDISVNDFDANGLTVTLFVLVTFLGIIVLLNMLIALVLESYEKSLLRSTSLFGRTRIALVAKSILLEEVLTKKARGCWGQVFNVTMRLFLGLAFLGILGYLIGISLYLLIDGGLDNGEILILSVGVVSTFLLLYFITVVLVYRMQGLGLLTPESTWVKFIELSFHYCFALPATYITLSLLGARKEYAHDDYGGWDELGGRLKRTDHRVTRRALAESKFGLRTAVLRLDQKLDQLQIQQRRDFIELRKLVEERDG